MVEVTDIAGFLISLLPRFVQWFIAGYILVGTVLFVAWLLFKGIPDLIKEWFSRPRW